MTSLTYSRLLVAKKRCCFSLMARSLKSSGVFKCKSMDLSVEELLQEKIKAQGDIVRKLKSEKVEKSLVRNNNEIFLDKIFRHFQNNLNSILIKLCPQIVIEKKEKDSFLLFVGYFIVGGQP